MNLGKNITKLKKLSAKNKIFGGTADWRKNGGLAEKWRNGGQTAERQIRRKSAAIYKILKKRIKLINFFNNFN